jgi:elongation factor G
VLGIDTSGAKQKINAHVPMSEVVKYAPDLRSITGGRGSFTMEFSSYEEAPPNVIEKVIEESKKMKEEGAD